MKFSVVVKTSGEDFFEVTEDGLEALPEDFDSLDVRDNLKGGLSLAKGGYSLLNLKFSYA